MDSKLYYMAVGLFVLVVILTVLFLYIIVNRLLELRQKGKIAEAKKNLYTPFYNYLIDGQKLARVLIPNQKVNVKAMEEILLDYSKNVNSDAVNTRITLYAEKYLQDLYRKQLKSIKWSTRINVLFKINDFHLVIMKDDLLRMLHSKKKFSKEEYIQIYKILADFEVEGFANLFLHSKIMFGELDYKKILFKLNDQQLKELIDLYDTLPLLLKRSLIEIIGIKLLGEWNEFLEKNLKDSDKEIRIRALKALEQIGVSSNIDIYLPFTKSEFWEERMILAKILRNMPITISEKFLLELIEDSSYLVRNQAAQSLKSYKNGRELLNKVIHTSKDQYAIDIALEQLRKG